MQQEQQNSQTLDDLIKDSAYTFRVLTVDDLPQLLILLKTCFNQHSELFHAMGMDEIETESFFQSINLYDDIYISVEVLSQGLSFGAFKDGQNVSAALGCDFNQDYKNKAEPTPNTAKLLQHYRKAYDGLIHLTEFQNGQLLFLFWLATHQEHRKHNLAVISLSLVVQEAKKKQYLEFVTDATHIGTIKSIHKVFKEWKIEKVLDNGLETQIIVMSAKL